MTVPQTAAGAIILHREGGMAIRVSADFRDFAPGVDATSRRARRAATLASNFIGQDILDRIRESFDEKLDRPTPFTKNGLRLFRARGHTDSAAVAIKPIQWDYLKSAFEGSTSTDEVIPSRAARLNKYGNMPRFYLKRLADRDGFWADAPSGVRTFFRRIPGDTLLAVAFRADRVSHRPRIDLKEEVNKIVYDRRLIRKRVDEAFKQVGN